jgi:hypothetical protein
LETNVLHQSNPDYDEKHCKAFVFDLTKDEWPAELQPNSVDAITMVFVLSALSPETMVTALRKLHSVLKPGGMQMQIFDFMSCVKLMGWIFSTLFAIWMLNRILDL